MVSMRLTLRRPILQCSPRPEKSGIPSIEQWVHKIKHDGFRIQAIVTPPASLLTLRSTSGRLRTSTPLRCLVMLLDEARAIVVGESIGHDICVCSDMASSKGFQ
jgi:hypothetical protein